MIELEGEINKTSEVEHFGSPKDITLQDTPSSFKCFTRLNVWTAAPPTSNGGYSRATKRTFMQTTHTMSSVREGKRNSQSEESKIY
jgi:hypothetical protein